MRSSQNLEQTLDKYCSEGTIVPRTENNKFLKLSYCGTGGLISEKWNVKIYTSGAVVSTDVGVLEDMLTNNINPPDENMIKIEIDDAGWGFPMLGVMVGATDGTRVVTDTISVDYFQGLIFEQKKYLEAYAQAGFNLIKREFGVSSQNHRIDICSGFINVGLKELLRSEGFDVRIVEVKGLLQDELEDRFKQYVYETLKADLAYDPKGFGKGRDGQKALSRKYYAVLDWGKKNVPHLLKSGWKSMQ